MRRGFVLPLLLLALARPTRVCASDPELVIQQALSQASSADGQARALVRLAWPDAPGDPALAARARQLLVDFGPNAILSLRVAIPQLKRADQADATHVLMEAARQRSGPLPSDYLPALEEATWFGSKEAKVLAIPELARYRYTPAVLTIVDAAYDEPELTQLCIEALGAMADEHARFFLEKQLNEGKAGTVDAAATALARIGGRALLPLKAALRSSERAVRENAARALLPVARVEELSSLFEYLAAYPNDDPATLEAVHQATIMLDKMREAREAAEAASSAPDSK